MDRREFLAGAAVSGAALVLPASAGAEEATAIVPEARPDVTHRGRALAMTPNARLALVAYTGRRLVSIVRRPDHARADIPLKGEPLEVAISPDGRWGAVTVAWWENPAVPLIDLKTWTLGKQLDAGPVPFDVAFASRDRLLVSGGEQKGTLSIFGHPDFAKVGEVALGRVPRGIGIAPKGKVAWVALNAEDAVVRVDLEHQRVTKRIDAGPQPDRVAVSPDGRHLLVSHGGHQSHSVTQIDTGTGKRREIEVGALPSAVAWTPNGKRLVALGGSNHVVVIANRGRHGTRQVAPGPRGLALARNRAFTVSTINGGISKVRV
jgi:DNA-binding beta-propeller fold protein YncE